VDFGTATTFDVVSREAEYLGGSLMTGIEISLEALSERGARLPKIDLAPPRSVIGKNTVDAIRSGVVYGYAGAIDAILRRIYDELGERADVVATGGLADLVVPYSEEIDVVDHLLTLTGLRLLHERNS
jgi:type III pantothenate kinase